MLPTFIILFREVLEISIILSLILAATRGVPGRGKWVLLGVGGGLLGSGVVAAFAGAIANAVEGMGQEVFNAGVLLLATLMIGWTVLWMQTHGRELAQKIKQVGKAVQEGDLPLYSVAVVVSLTMWREGAEIVLFMTGILSTSQESILAILAGGVGGALMAGSIGLALYLGLIKLSTRYLFSVTSWLLVLLACGMSAQAVHYLSAADMIPILTPQMWDSSWLLSEESLMGKILHAMLGYTERPSGIQLAAYLTTFVLISGTLALTRRPAASLKKAVAAAALILTALLVTTHEARAFDVDTPYVEQGMAEIELQNRVDFNDRASEDRFRQHKLGVGYGFTSWWGAELEGEWEKDAGRGYQFTATELENVFQFTEAGEYLVDVGAEVKYEWSHETGGADKVEAYLLLAKQTPHFTHVANIGIEQEVGSHKNENPEGEFKWMSKYNYTKQLNPGVEYYAELGEYSDMPGWNEQKHRIGPALYGSLGGGVKYEVGYLFGISKAAEDHSLKLNLEYEFAL